MKGVAQADQTAVDRLILSSKAVLMRSIDWLTILIDQERHFFLGGETTMNTEART